MSQDTPKERAVSNGREPAFPTLEEYYSGIEQQWKWVTTAGMTKREVIAKDCLVGILSMSTPPNISNEQALAAYLKYPSMLAVMQADALLEALDAQ